MKGSALLKFLALTVLLLLAVSLLMDALAFALYPADPATGRARGCYTTLELLLGVKRPTEWARLTQFAVAGGIAVSCVVLMIRWWRSR
jgi:hypothetical protein